MTKYFSILQHRLNKSNTIEMMFPILLAVIVMLNAIRSIFNIYENSIIVYVIYFITIVAGIYQLKNKVFKINENNAFLYLNLLLIVIYGGITSINTHSFIIFIKFCIILIVFYLTMHSSVKDLGQTVNFIHIIGDIYMLICLFFPNYIQNYIQNGSNYLVVTLPLALTMTIHLERLIAHSYYTDKRFMVFHLILSLLCFCSITNFVARSSIIFPIFIAVLVLILVFKRELKRLLIYGLILIFIFVLLYIIFSQNISDYGYSRMIALFAHLWEEDRWIIWSDYISWIFDNKYIIMGGGLNSSMVYLHYYPHNIFLQLIGEFGLIGISLNVYLFTIIAKIILKYNSSVKFLDKNTNILFLDLFSGLVYFILVFSKSFSLFSAIPLFIYIAMFINYGNITFISDKSNYLLFDRIILDYINKLKRKVK